MSPLNRSVDFAREITRAVEAGNFEGASHLLSMIHEQPHAPHVCNQEVLAALQKARALVIIRRSGLLGELRSLEASRLYDAPVAPSNPSWQLEG